MNLSIRRKKSAESNKIDKTKLSVKNFKQIYQENKNRPLTKNEKRGWAILGGIIIAILVIAHVSNVMEQSRLEKDNVPIVISDVEDNIKLDYHTDKREISAKLEKAKQEEKERAEQAKKAAEEKKKQEEAAAAAANQQQAQSQSQPAASSELNFSNCKEARAAGYSHMRRGEPGYAPHLDRDGDGIACDKHR